MILRKTPWCTLGVVALLGGTAVAQNARPFQATASLHDVMSVDQIDKVSTGAIDQRRVRLEDEERDANGLPPRFAIPRVVSITPATHGTWENAGDDVMWRLRIRAEGAASVNLGFGKYFMPPGGQLQIYSPDMKRSIRPFTHEDNDAHGQLWTPILQGDEVVVELTLSKKASQNYELELIHIGHGYRGFHTRPQEPQIESGACNVDVVCPDGDDWQNEIPSVAAYSTGGSIFCTGFMVNNTANDRTNYFMTANHCGIGAGNAASLVVYWNFETSTCGGTPDGVLTDFQTGAVHRASHSPSDFTLLELDDDPDPAWGITYSGWDNTGAEATTAVAIHHPDGDEKRISYEFDPTTTTSYLSSAVPGAGTHVRVEDWDTGTTEPGSSGSPLYDQNHRVIGQLHGGFAACGNDDADWYGRISVSWNGGGTASSRLSDWLDPGNTGATAVDTLGIGMSVTPGGTVTHEGPFLGPFTNPTTTYTVKNNSNDPVGYNVSLVGTLGLLINGGTAPISGTLIAGASITVDVTFDTPIMYLAKGTHTETINFEDTTNSITSTRTHQFVIGQETILSFPMDSDPGWTTEGAWDFGVPAGGGGVSYGLPDPSSGATGANVYGFNLSGDYTNNMPETHLTTTALDLTGVSGAQVSFQRWLNVEQPLYDHAYFRISTNGSTWTTLWENGAEITDSAWTEQVFDISAIADGESTVYLRWTQGTTDGSWIYAGWNIDDVVISGILLGEFTKYGTGCPGAGGLVPDLSGIGSPSPSAPITLEVTDARPNGFGLLFYSAAPDSASFGPGSCTLLVAPPLPAPILAPLNASGTFTLNGLLPPVVPGVHLYWQFLGTDPGAPVGNKVASNGLDMYIY